MGVGGGGLARTAQQRQFQEITITIPEPGAAMAPEIQKALNDLLAEFAELHKGKAVTDRPVLVQIPNA